MKKWKIIGIILIISLIMTIGISYSNKVRLKEYSDNNFKVSYDTTWKIDKKESELKLIHKKTNSILRIQCKILDSNYIDVKLRDIERDIINSIEQQNSDYILINKSSNNDDEYESYSYLYEKDMEQVLVNVYKKDKKLVIAYYEANSEYYDIVLDSVDTILDSLEIIVGEKIK